MFDALKELVDDSLEVSQSYDNYYQATFIQQLVGVRSKAILRRISSPYEGTCTWITDYPVYLDWRLGFKEKVLWLWGPPGIGKTIMMKYLIERFDIGRKKTTDDREIVAYFFCDDKDWLRRTHVYVALSFLDQIIAQDSTLIRYVDLKDIQQYVEICDLDEDELPSEAVDILWRAIQSIVRRSLSKSFWFLVDALDELEPSSRRNTLDHFQLILAMDLARRVHVVFSDRIAPHARSVEFPALACELGGDDAKHDVRRYLSGQCDRFTVGKRIPTSLHLSMKTTLFDVAQGNFLHATLAWANFQKGVSFWSIRLIEDRLERVRNISRDTVSYYCSLLEKIPGNLVAISRRAFAWVVGTRRALTVKELQHAIALHPRQSKWSDLERAKAITFEQEFEENFSYLLRCDYDGFVRLAHQTIKEILTSKPNEFSPANEATLKCFRVNDENLHAEITRGCLTLISFQNFAQGGFQDNINNLVQILKEDIKDLQYADAADAKREPQDLAETKEEEESRQEANEQKVQDSLQSSEFVLVFYTACFWSSHFAQCSSDATAVTLLARFLKKRQARLFYIIPIILKLLPVPRASTFIEGPIFRSYPPIHLLLQIGDYPAVIDELVSSGEDPNQADRSKSTPLLYAIANKRPKTVKFLLSLSSVEVNRKPYMPNGPIHIACREGSSADILETIIDDARVDINEKNQDGQAPLHILMRVPTLRKTCLKLLRRGSLHILEKNEHSQTLLGQCFIDGLDEEFALTILLRPDFKLETLKEFEDKGLKTSNYASSYLTLARQWGWHRVERHLLEKDPKRALQTNEDGMSLLEAYAFYGLENRLKDLLDHLPADTYQRYAPRNSRLLHLCAQQGWESLALLLQGKFKINTMETDEHSRTMLFYAAEFGWHSIVSLCEGRSPEQINHQSRDGRTALIVAVENRNVVAVKALLEARADVLINDKRGRAAVHAAAEHGHRHILKLLLQKPYREYGRDNQSRALLHYISMWQSKDFITRYIKKSRPIINIFDNRRRTPLIYAAMHRNTLAAEALLDSNADPSLKDVSGSTAMHHALSEGDLSFVKLLLERDVPISELDGYKRSAMHLALRSKNIELTEYLLNLIMEQRHRRKADPRASKSEFDLSYMISHRDISGQTVMHRACFLENKVSAAASAYGVDEEHVDTDNENDVVGQCVSALCLLGANINEADRYQATPLHIAVKNNNRAAVRALLSHEGIQVNPPDNQGCTPLDWSVAQSQIRITKLLRDHNARHSPNFRQVLNVPPPQVDVRTEYDPNQWAVVHSRHRWDDYE